MIHKGDSIPQEKDRLHATIILERPTEAVENHLKLSDTRRETLAWLALLIMQQGTICLWRLAAYVASPAQTDSVRRRFYRFFQHVKLDGAAAACVVVDLLGLFGELCRKLGDGVKKAA